jgi:hypothetical protein
MILHREMIHIAITHNTYISVSREAIPAVVIPEIRCCSVTILVRRLAAVTPDGAPLPRD